MPNEYKIFKHEIVRFYKRKKKFDFYKIEPLQLKITDKQDAYFYRLWRNQIKDELIKEGILISKEPYHENIMHYVKPKTVWYKSIEIWIKILALLAGILGLIKLLIELCSNG